MVGGNHRHHLFSLILFIGCSSQIHAIGFNYRGFKEEQVILYPSFHVYHPKLRMDFLGLFHWNVMDGEANFGWREGVRLFDNIGRKLSV